MKSILLIFTLAAVQCSCTFAQTLKGKVVHVADGDTFTLLSEDKTTRKIRLHGIDCPEKRQDFGNVAKQFTIQHCKGKNVTVIQKGKDQYGRTVGLVLVNRDTLNVLLLKAGLAWHFKKYDNDPVWGGYERNARKEKKGLWSMKEATPPWEWRQSKR